MNDADRGLVSAGAADVYEQFFVPALFGQWATPVLDQVGHEPTMSVLDIGCGTGVVARAAARRVAPGTRIVGLDLNRAMLEVAARAPETVEWVHGSAEDLPFDDDAFDLVVCSFALMFFDDRRRALTEMARTLAPGGTAAIVTWARLDLTPGYAAMVDLLDRLFGEEAAAALRAPFALGDPATVHDVMGEVFAATRIITMAGVARFDSIEAWMHTEVRGWTLSEMIDDDSYRRLVSEARQVLGAFVRPDGTVEFPAPALLATVRP